MLDTKGNRITYFGHSTFSLATPTGKTALIDPWVMTNPVCPAALKKLARLDAIFLTHSHSDHMGDLLGKKPARWARAARKKWTTSKLR